MQRYVTPTLDEHNRVIGFSSSANKTGKLAYLVRDFDHFTAHMTEYKLVGNKLVHSRSVTKAREEAKIRCYEAYRIACNRFTGAETNTDVIAVMCLHLSGEMTSDEVLRKFAPHINLYRQKEKLLTIIDSMSNVDELEVFTCYFETENLEEV